MTRCETQNNRALAQGRQFLRMAGALMGGQLRRTWVVGVAVPLLIGVLIAAVGALWRGLAGVLPATMAMMAVSQLYPMAAGMCALAVLANDALVEVQESTPMGFRAVQTARASMLSVGVVAGAAVMFAALETMGVVYRDIGWLGVVTPAGGALIMVLVAFVAASTTSTARAATLEVMAAWLFFSLIWDPNVIPLELQRGVPLLVMLAVAAVTWHVLGIPGYAFSKKGRAR